METAASYIDGGGAESPSTQQAAVESTNTQDASAVNSESQSAAIEGVQEVEAESTELESAEGATEEKKGHQKTLEERAEEIADRKVQQRLAEAEQRKQEAAQAQPDFIPVDYNAYDNHIAKLILTERQIQDDLALEPEDPAALVRQLRTVQRDRAVLEQSFNANEAKRQAWEQRNQISEQQKAFIQQTQTDIEKAVPLLAASRGLAPEVIEAGREFVNKAFQADPALQRRFDDIITHRAAYQGFSGVNAAVDWAISYAQENMGKAAAASQQKREAGKEITIGATNAGTETTGNISTYADLLKLPSKDINAFAKAHPQKYQNLKDKHFK